MTKNHYSIFDRFIEGIQIIDTDFRYQYVNDTVVQHGKYLREELLGHTMMEKYPGIEKTEMFAQIKKCIETGIHHHMVNEFDFPDTSKGYFELRMQPVEEGVLIMSIDVTDQKRAEQYLKNSNKILDEKVKERTHELEQKNREMEQFTYIASHDLQEPLRTITNYINAFKEDYDPILDETAKKFLNAIESATQRMERLTNGLLDFSRLGRSKVIREMDFAVLIQEVLDDLNHVIQNSGAKIKIEKMPAMRVYDTEVRQLFQNLISNAIKFRKTNETPEILISAKPKDEKWEFTVKDNGIGIEPKYFERIFQIFQRLHLSREYEGTGIGLANCKKIVQLHRGEIYVESEPGKGSTFIFTLSNL